jgi:HK97 family phage portal protein
MVQVQPNPDCTGVTFWSAATVTHTIYGEAYIEIQRDGSGNAIAMWLRRPDLTRTMRSDDGVLYYETQDGPQSNWRRIDADDCIHIQGTSLDGICSLQTVQLLRNEIGNDLATLYYGGRFMKNNGAPSVVLKTNDKTVLKPEQREQMLVAYLEKQTGPRQHLPFIVDQGMDVVPISQNFVGADLVNYSRLCAERICAALRCPPSLVGLMDRAPRNSAEEQTRSFLTFSLSPLLRQIESAVEAKLPDSA